MSSDWRQVELGEVVSIRKEKIDIENISVENYISTENMLPDKGGVTASSNLPTTRKVDSFYSGDVLFSNIRTYFKKVWQAGFDGGASGDVVVFHPKSKNELNADFLYYLISSDQFISYTVATSKGTKMPRGDKKAILQYESILPPLPTQKAIAHILGTLDDKIELNRKMNETLEAMAQALFKSWFVDFDPVLDKALAAGNEIPEPLQQRAQNRQQILNSPPSQGGVPGGRGGSLIHTNPELVEAFPDRFVFTEALGWIPEGWKAGSFKQFSNVIGGFAFKSKDFVEKGSYPVVKIKNINGAGGVNLVDCQSLAYDPVDIDPKFKLKSGDLLMAMTGATVGKFGLVVPNDNTQPLLNQRVAKYVSVIRGDSRIWFTYFYLKQKHVFDHIVNSAYGSAQPNISATDLLRTPAVKVPTELISAFNETTESKMLKVLSNVKINRSLIKLRDTLLPKLISGELEVPADEKLIADHA